MFKFISWALENPLLEDLDNMVEYNVWFLVHFRQFPTFNFGLAHYGSWPFIFLYRFSIIILYSSWDLSTYFIYIINYLLSSKWCLCIHFASMLPGILNSTMQRLLLLIYVNINKHHEALSWHGRLVLKRDCTNKSLTLSLWALTDTKRGCVISHKFYTFIRIFLYTSWSIIERDNWSTLEGGQAMMSYATAFLLTFKGLANLLCGFYLTQGRPNRKYWDGLVLHTFTFLVGQPIIDHSNAPLSTQSRHPDASYIFHVV